MDLGDDGRRLDPHLAPRAVAGGVVRAVVVVDVRGDDLYAVAPGPHRPVGGVGFAGTLAGVPRGPGAGVEVAPRGVPPVIGHAGVRLGRDDGDVCCDVEVGEQVDVRHHDHRNRGDEVPVLELEPEIRATRRSIVLDDEDAHALRALVHLAVAVVVDLVAGDLVLAGVDVPVEVVAVLVARRVPIEVLVVLVEHGRRVVAVGAGGHARGRIVIAPAVAVAVLGAGAAVDFREGHTGVGTGAQIVAVGEGEILHGPPLSRGLAGPLRPRHGVGEAVLVEIEDPLRRIGAVVVIVIIVVAGGVIIVVIVIIADVGVGITVRISVAVSIGVTVRVGIGVGVRIRVGVSIGVRIAVRVGVGRGGLVAESAVARLEADIVLERHLVGERTPSSLAPLLVAVPLAVVVISPSPQRGHEEHERDEKDRTGSQQSVVHGTSLSHNRTQPDTMPGQRTTGKATIFLKKCQ